VHVRIDPNKCQGHTLCAIAAPSVFHLREDDGHAFVSDAEVSPDLESAVLDGAETCPERAIEVTP
jgi:ferredoxin